MGDVPEFFHLGIEVRGFFDLSFFFALGEEGGVTKNKKSEESGDEQSGNHILYIIAYLKHIRDDMELDMAVTLEVVVESKEVGEFFEELGLVGSEVGFVGEFDGGADDGEGEGAGVVFFLREVGGESEESFGVGDNELFGEGFDFIVGDDGAAEIVDFF